MDRELVLVGLMVSAVGVTLLAGAPWLRTIAPTASARQWERASWRALWSPIIPAVVVVSVLVGWALMEPAQSDEQLPSSALVVGTLFIGLWIRAAIRAVRALKDDRSVAAGTIGLWRPRVVLSDELITLLDRDALEAVRAHEAAHRRHRDPLRIWLAQLVTDLQWPWPAAQKRFKHWRYVLELARDEEGRVYGADGVDLAAAVLLAARLNIPRLAGASLIENQIGIEERIARLLAPVHAGDVPIAMAGTLALFPVSLLGVLSGVRFGEGLVQIIVKWLP